MCKTRYKSQSASVSKESEEFVCVNCQEVSSTLYKKYSEGVIRLTECRKCGELVDKYIEYDVVLVVIDLMLQYVQAYRHLILNVKIQRPERIFILFWLSHAAEVWIRDKGSNEARQVGDHEWIFYRCLLLSAGEIFSFIFIILLYSVWKNKETSCRHLIGSTLLGYYGNVAVVISFIFHLSHRTSYQVVLQVFLLVSHVQVQRVLFPTVSDSDNIIVVLVAKTFSTYTGILLTSAV